MPGNKRAGGGARKKGHTVMVTDCTTLSALITFRTVRCSKKLLDNSNKETFGANLCIFGEYNLFKTLVEFQSLPIGCIC